jgi:hypothetical protein
MDGSSSGCWEPALGLEEEHIRAVNVLSKAVGQQRDDNECALRVSKVPYCGNQQAVLLRDACRSSG